MDSYHSRLDYSRSHGSLFTFFISHLKRPVLDIQVTENPIYSKKQELLKKEFYFLVTNRGKSTARDCRVTIAQRHLAPVEKGEMLNVTFETFRVVYLDWFEPSIGMMGELSDLQPKLGKSVDIFPDINHHLLAGRLEVFVNSIGSWGIMGASIVTEEERIEGKKGLTTGPEVRGLMPYGLTLAGEKHTLEIVFSWEREHLETLSLRYLLSLGNSLERTSLTLCPDRFPDERFPSVRF